MKPKHHCTFLATILVSLLIGCSPTSGTSSSEPKGRASRAEASITRVLHTDAISYQNAKSVAEVVIRMRSIDLAGCPNDFQAAYLSHIHAWENLAIVEQQAIALDAHYSSGGAFLEAFVRGTLGDPFGKAAESVQAYKVLQYNFAVAQAAVRQSYQKVERVAVLHGAELPRYTFAGS